MFGSSLGDLALRRVWNHRIHRSRTSLRSLRSTPFSSLTYAELWSRFPSSFIVLVEADLVAFSYIYSYYLYTVFREKSERI